MPGKVAAHGRQPAHCRAARRTHDGFLAAGSRAVAMGAREP